MDVNHHAVNKQTGKSTAAVVLVHQRCPDRGAGRQAVRPVLIQ
jgi:hypothetical protein